MQFQAEEALLQLADLLEVQCHVRILGLVGFVREVDHKLRVALDDEALDAESDGGPDACQEALLLGDVVGDLGPATEAELHRVVDLVARW